jgi:hypothetical protein
MVELNNKRLKIYGQLPESMQRVYSSEETIRFQVTMLDRFRIGQEKRDAYLDLVGDTILGISEAETLEAKIQTDIGLEATEARQLAGEITRYIKPALEYHQDPEAYLMKEQVATETPATLLSTAPNVAPVEPMTAGEANVVESVSEPTVQPLRTMETDVKRIHGYGAYRELYPNTPSATDSEEPIHTSSQASVLPSELTPPAKTPPPESLDTPPPSPPSKEESA